MKTINCTKCKIILDDNTWQPCRKRQNRKICKYCNADYNHISHLKNKAENVIINKQIRWDTKVSVFSYYGNKCVLCGEDDIMKLSLDHMNGNGRQHRKEVLGTDSGSGFYNWVNINKPDNIRLLCYNCNCSHNMTKIDLVINNKDYLINKNCRYCGSDIKVNTYRCAKCKYISKCNYRVDLKAKAYEKYGGHCVECGCDDFKCLTIDHINNNGAAHRKEIGADIYTWLKLNNYPKEGFQILCFNCNYAKYFKTIK